MAVVNNVNIIERNRRSWRENSIHLTLGLRSLTAITRWDRLRGTRTIHSFN